MATVGYDLCFRRASTKFGESTPLGPVAALPPSELIDKTVCLNEPAGSTLDQARMRLANSIAASHLA